MKFYLCNMYIRLNEETVGKMYYLALSLTQSWKD